MKTFLCIFVSLICLTAFCNFDDLIDKADKPIAAWAHAQIKEDLSFFKNRPISLKKINDFYEENSVEYQLIKFTIQNNKVSAEWEGEYPGYREWTFKEIIEKLATLLPLPDTVFLLSTQGSFDSHENIPVFGMCKKKQAYATILIPDFDALKGAFQVLPDKDLLQYEHPWNKKGQKKLMWRGGTAQGVITSDNLDKRSRVTLCALSLQYPTLINARFTSFSQGAAEVPFLHQFGAGRNSFEEQFQYKYHILIDGNASADTFSCWKLFSNSLIFKPSSPNTQWYHKGLQPWVHYVPVKENLKDLTQKIQWAQAHDKEAEIMAHNARSFAVNNLSVSDNLIYFYHVLWHYSNLKFTN